jgi:hypothetical protein
MGVKIDIHDLLAAQPKQSPDGKYRIIQVAKPGGTIRPAVMRTARRMKDHVSLCRQLCRQYGTTNGHPRTFEKPVKQRVLKCADLETLAYPAFNGPCGVCVLKGPEIGAIMEFKKFCVTRRLALAKTRSRQPAKHIKEIDDSSVPHNVEWVVFAKGGPAINIAADKQRLRSLSNNLRRPGD